MKELRFQVMNCLKGTLDSVSIFKFHEKSETQFLKKLIIVKYFSGRDGGIISTTRKRRIQQKIELDQKLHEEHERSKKYTGPVGSNPWGQIAQDWTGTKKSSNDFEDDLKVLAAQLRQNKSPLANKDWDAPPPEFGFRAGDRGDEDDDHDFQPKRKRKLLYM